MHYWYNWRDGNSLHSLYLYSIFFHIYGVLIVFWNHSCWISMQNWLLFFLWIVSLALLLFKDVPINTNFLFIEQYLFSKYLLPYGIMRSVVQIWWFKEALSYGGRYIFYIEINMTFSGEQSRWSKKCAP